MPDIKALRVAMELETPIFLLNNLGTTMTEAGDYKTALDYLGRASTLADRLLTVGIAGRLRASFHTITLNNMAVVHSSSGELDVALGEINEVIAMHRAAGEDEDAAVALVNAATIYGERNDNTAAQRYLEQALRLYAGAQDLSGVVTATLYLAILARRENKLPEAATGATEALSWRARLATLAGSARPRAAWPPGDWNKSNSAPPQPCSGKPLPPTRAPERPLMPNRPSNCRGACSKRRAKTRRHWPNIKRPSRFWKACAPRRLRNPILAASKATTRFTSASCICSSRCIAAQMRLIT